MRRGVVEDARGLGHLHHERRAAAGQIVGCADTREDTIDGPDAGVIGRNEAAGVGEDDDQRRLAHIGRLTTHIRAGNDQQPAAIVEIQIVGNERVVTGLLDA